MNSKERIFPLKGKIQHYSWGGYEFIPSLLDIENADRKPCAEYWMGAHPSASSEVNINGNTVSFHALIQQDPAKYITEDVFNRFGGLPYLFKVLDVKDMLSIQVHPTKEEALKGFEAEEAEGIPINAPHRNYKDKNHKPEVMVALGDFWLLHGFKSEAQLKETLNRVPAFNFLFPVFEQQGYFGLYKQVMELPQEKVNEILRPLVQDALKENRGSAKNEPAYWVNKLYAGQEIKDIDRGVFSIYFFNIMQVQPGEAVFQGAGIPHAYLEGQNVELMANSDNVLRGGLTTKHIDVPELLKHTTFEGVEPVVLKGTALSQAETLYPCPVEDFAISAIRLKAGESCQGSSYSAEICIVIEGKVSIGSPEPAFKKGEVFLVLPRTEYRLSAISETLIYKAFVPEINA